MHAEVISIGTELTTGAKLDTNSQWLSQELAGIGIAVHYHTTVADDLAANVSVLCGAVERADVVLITGGLGPTLDDLTREVIAELMGVELELHEPSLEFIKDLFARRGREMPERNRVQAMFPVGSEPLPNPRGSAPGVWAEIARAGRSGCKLAAMPGVPSEMKPMFHREVLPRLQDKTSRVIRQARVNCFGAGESQAEEWLGDLTRRGRDPEVGITASKATITLRITAQGDTEEDCARKIRETKQIIYERMGRTVFGEEDDKLQHVVIRLLGERGETLSVAESGTGGLLSHAMTEVDGFESCFQGGLVAPTVAAKVGLLCVDRDVLVSAGPVSGEVATAMAAGCRERFGTDYALAVTECPRANPDEESPGVPTAFIALAGLGDVEVRELNLGGDPAILKIRVAKSAMNLLRLRLTDCGDEQ